MSTIPATFESRPISACWRWLVKVETKSKKRTSSTTYEVIGIDRSIAKFNAEEKVADKKRLVSVGEPFLIGLVFAYYTDTPNLPWLEGEEKRQLERLALQANKI